MHILRCIAVILTLALSACGGAPEPTAPGSAEIEADEGLTFSDPTNIDNPFLPLSKFSLCVMEGEEEDDGETIELRIERRLLDKTERFEVEGQPVDAVTIEDSEFEDGELVEKTLDYFAQGDDGTVYYMGEDVNDYEDGKLVGHEGEWRVGRDTETPGVLMPGDPTPGTKWRAEDVPGVTVEKDESVEILDKVKVAGVTYEQVLRVRERSSPGEMEYKLYASGTGLIQELPEEGHLDLIRCR